MAPIQDLYSYRKDFPFVWPSKQTESSWLCFLWPNKVRSSLLYLRCVVNFVQIWERMGGLRNNSIRLLQSSAVGYRRETKTSALTALGYSGPLWQGAGESSPCCLASSISALQLTRVPGGSTECTAISTVPATCSVWSMWRVGNCHDSSAKFFPTCRKSFFFLGIFYSFVGQNVSSRFWTWNNVLN